jgi:hypothetical protein
VPTCGRKLHSLDANTLSEDESSIERLVSEGVLFGTPTGTLRHQHTARGVITRHQVASSCQCAVRSANAMATDIVVLIHHPLYMNLATFDRGSGPTTTRIPMKLSHQYTLFIAAVRVSTLRTCISTDHVTKLLQRHIARRLAED